MLLLCVLCYKRLSVPFSAPISLLHHHLISLSPDAMECFVNDKPAVKVLCVNYCVSVI